MVSLSIITVTYNAAATIADCLQSLSNQTFTPAEHIIIDGGSADNTLEVVKNLRFNSRDTNTNLTPSGSPLTRIISEPDSGIYDAMNKGIALVKGDIIGILNADDFYASDDVLAKVAKVFEDQSVMCCYGDLEYVREKQGHGFKVVRYWKSGAFTPRAWYFGWMPPHPTFFVRRCVYERFGRFRLDMGSAADYELMLRFLLKQGLRTVYIPKVLVRMRVGGASNASVAARVKANAMDRLAWTVNGLKPLPLTLLCKPLRKINQYVLPGFLGRQ